MRVCTGVLHHCQLKNQKLSFRQQNTAWRRSSNIYSKLKQTLDSKINCLSCFHPSQSPPQLIATHNAPLLCSSSSSSCLEEFGVSCCFPLLSLKASQGFTEPLVKKVWHLSLISASLSPHLSCFMLFLPPPNSPLICAPVWTRQPGEVAPPALRRFFGRP